MEDESHHKKRLQRLLHKSYCELRGIDMMKYLPGDHAAPVTQNQSIINNWLSIANCQQQLNISELWMERRQRVLERSEILRLFAVGVNEEQLCSSDGVNCVMVVLRRWYNELVTCSNDDVLQACRNVYLVGGSQLSFETSINGFNFKIMVSPASSRETPTGRKSLPSTVSSDGLIRFASSIDIPAIADLISQCVTDKTDARTMIRDVLWRTISNEIDLLR